MTLVERLRARYPDDTDCMAAAAEIERLEAVCAAWAIRHGQLGTEMGYMRELNAALMECYTHLTYVADTEKALESIRKVETLLEQK